MSAERNVEIDTKAIKVTAVVAMAQNNCIGKNNDLPWHIPADLKRFKELTFGKPVVMGRKTFQSIIDFLGKPLPGRTNIIVSRSGFEHDFDKESVVSYTDLDEAIAFAKQQAAIQGHDEIIIGGGAQIYTQALPLCDILHLTEVHQNVDGDAFFPKIPPAQFEEQSRKKFEATDKTPAYSFITLNRI